MPVLKQIDQVLAHLEELHLQVEELETLLGVIGDHASYLTRLRMELWSLESSVYDQLPKGV